MRGGAGPRWLLSSRRRGAGLPLTLLPVCAEHVPGLRFPLPVWDGRLLRLSHTAAASSPPAPRHSEPGNTQPVSVSASGWECGL